MTGVRKVRALRIAGVLMLVGAAGCSQAGKPSAAAGGSPATSATPAGVPKDVWISQTTGREYRVRQEGGRLYAEWSNMSGAFLAHGAYIRSECKRQATKWVGVSHSHLPCVEGNLPEGQYTNWCDVETKIEFDDISPTRISGYGEGLKRFDCQKCKILETNWLPFTWIPKK